MGLLRVGILCSLVSIISCAKLSYLTEQGLGQAKLIFGAKKNEEVLSDPKVSAKNKEKIRKIIKYKQYFYKYWQKKPSGSYDKTIMLDRDAVTYLVIAAPKNSLKPKRECFLLAGCFPYLGFFKVDSAKAHAKSLAAEYDTYIRKVPAYSLLGYMDDPIISTFFNYSEYNLAETIFHELFHTIFFVKNEVDLNENLANYIGKQMVYEYFGNSKELKAYFAREEKNRELMLTIVKQAKKLEEGLRGPNWRDFKKNFFTETFPDEIKKTCQKLNMSFCWPEKIKWNNATISAFMTYEKEQSRISVFIKEKKLNLREFYELTVKKYEEYTKKDPSSSFEDFLFAK